MCNKLKVILHIVEGTTVRSKTVFYRKIKIDIHEARSAKLNVIKLTCNIQTDLINLRQTHVCYK